jgi:hypothetical protein
MPLLGYEPFSFPASSSFREMSSEEAQDYFENFVQTVPERISEIQRQLALTGSDIVLDFSVDSVSQLGAWFDAHVEARAKTTEELLEEYADTPDWLRDRISKDTLTSQTISLCMDIGIYFAETLRRYHPHLKWALRRAPANDVSFRQPVLVPFKNVYFNPFIIMLNVAGDVKSGKSAGEEVARLFRVWESFVTT